MIRFHLDKANPEFVFLHTTLSSYGNWGQVYSVRSGQPGLNAEEIKSLKILLLCQEGQNKIADYVNKLRYNISIIVVEIGAIQRFKKGFLQKNVCLMKESAIYLLFQFRANYYLFFCLSTHFSKTLYLPIFPISASILDHIKDYVEILEQYSHPILEHIDWKPTPDNNVEVLNETIDYYRYFDATLQAEFLYDCVQDTIENIIPNEVNYLERYDEFKRYIDDVYEMPDKLISLLVSFLRQGEGKLSKRALKKEFTELSEKEIIDIESKFR